MEGRMRALVLVTGLEGQEQLGWSGICKCNNYSNTVAAKLSVVESIPDPYGYLL